MPRFEDDCFKQLSLCHQDLQTLFYEVVKHVPCKIMKVGERDPNIEGLSTIVHVLPVKENDTVDWDDVFLNSYFTGVCDGICGVLRHQGKIHHPIRKTNTDQWEVVL